MDDKEIKLSKDKKKRMKIKLFNKLYKDMQESIKIVLKRNNDQTFTVKKNSILITFAEEMDTNVSLFDNNDEELLKKVSILNDFFCNKPALSKANQTVVWKYIESMYSLARGEKKLSLNKREDFNMSSISEVVGTLLNDEPGGMKDLINEISGKLEVSMEGKNIDQSQILKDLMGGNMESCGINFQDIIAESSKNLQEKVQNGEIDIPKLKDIASKLKSGMNL